MSQLLVERVSQLQKNLEERVSLLEFRMKLIEGTSKDNNDRLKRIERIFWIGIGLLGGNLVGALAILEKLKILP